MSNLIKHWPTAIVVFTVGGVEALGSHGLLIGGTVTVVTGLITLIGQYLPSPAGSK